MTLEEWLTVLAPFLQEKLASYPALAAILWAAAVLCHGGVPLGEHRLQLRVRRGKRLRTIPRPQPFSTARSWRCESGAESLCGSGLSHPVDVVAAAAARWTVADCALGKFLGQNSSPASFCSGAGKRDDPGAKIRVADAGCRSSLGQQARLGHSWNGVDLQNERLPVLG